MEEMTVNPKHVTLPDNENEGKVIAGLESIEKPFKVNLSPIINRRELGSLASRKNGLKARRPSLNDNPRPPKTSSNPKRDKETDSITSDAGTAQTLAKNTLIQSATVLKKTPLKILSFLGGTPTYPTNKIWRCLTNNNSRERK